ncbi:MAG: peptidoglycan-binding protein, partial [Clostridiales bacterium]|nr:peptidoglycan-binding protein [Clostridiales bacterium]
MKKRFLFFLIVFMLAFSLFVNADFGDRLLKKGMSGYDVNVLQNYLNQLGYFNENELTNYFGPVTEEAVRKFQEEYDELEVDGIVGKTTSKYIIAKINQINLIKEKERKEKELAASVQQDLKELGYYSGEITSIIDKATVVAIKAFQEKEGFEVTGELDKVTLDKLNELFPKKIEEEKDTITGRALVDFTSKYLGTPYVFGESSG